MNEELKQIQKEHLSALADGQLAPEEMSAALAFAASVEGQQTWQLYQLVGDVLRSPELAHHAQHDVLPGVRAQLAREPRPQHQPLTPVAQALRQGVGAQDTAANSAVFRWKMAAGLASVAAVAALGWGLLLSGGAGPAVGVQLAASSQPAPAVTVAVEGDRGAHPDEGAQVMLRDPRLDELLAAHRQYSGVAALQMPADFLRNANFSNSTRQP